MLTNKADAPAYPHIHERTKQLMLALVDCAGIFYEMNLTQDKLIGVPIKYHKGERIPLLQHWGLPSDCTYSALVDFWKKFLPEELHEEYVSHTSLKFLRESFAQGKHKLNYKCTSKTEYGEPMLANRTTYLYEDSATGDVLGMVYVKNEYELNEAKQKSLAAEEASFRDPLTHCYNRRKLEQFAKNYLKQPNAQASMFFIDLDGFKKLNDTFGHRRGDEILIEEAKSIQSVFYDDDIVARIGGDEFVVFMPEVVDDTVVYRKANELKMKCFRSFTNAEGISMELSVSIGVCRYPEACASYDELYEHADVALYYAKRQGKNSFAFYRDIPEEERNMEITVGEDVEYSLESLTDEDYRALLNCFPNVGMYVVTEAEHRILFYNAMAKAARPVVNLGAVCYKVFTDGDEPCSFCPIKKLGTRPCAFDIHDDPYLGRICITVTRMLWHGKVPAILVRVYPHMERGMKAKGFKE